MKKSPWVGVFALVVLVLLLPLYPKLFSDPVTFGRVEQAFKRYQYTVSDWRGIDPPGLESKEHVSMWVENAQVDVYRYDNEGLIFKHLEYAKPEEDSAMADAWRQSESGGRGEVVKHDAARNDMFLLVVRTNDDTLRRGILAAFAGL